MHRAGGVLIALLLVAACRQQNPAPVPDDGLRDADGIAAAALAEKQIPGLSLVIQQGGRVVLARGYGFADPKHTERVTERTIFQLGSISKQFVSALVVRLADERRLALDDPITAHLPEFKRLPPDTTIRHLLTHTSGIREPFSMPEYRAGIEDPSRPAEAFVEVLHRAPVDFSAGARWSYSNANYMILALLIERVTGKPYERALADEFFQPLDLASFHHCAPLPRHPRDARGHVLKDGAPVPAAPENLNWCRGDGGLCGSALDLARWTRLLASGRVVSAESYRLMSAPARTHDGRTVDYGFGLSLVPLETRRKIAHNGAMLGFSASAAYYPDDQLTVVVLTNRGDVRTEAIERAIARRVLKMPAPALAAQPLPLEQKQRAIGSYDIGVFPIRIVDRGDRLWLEMPSPGTTTPLRHVGNGEFVSDTDPDATRLTFGAGADVRLYMGAMHWYGVRRP